MRLLVEAQRAIEKMNREHDEKMANVPEKQEVKRLRAKVAALQRQVDAGSAEKEKLAKDKEQLSAELQQQIDALAAEKVEVMKQATTEKEQQLAQYTAVVAERNALLQHKTHLESLKESFETQNKKFTAKLNEVEEEKRNQVAALKEFRASVTSDQFGELAKVLDEAIEGKVDTASLVTHLCRHAVDVVTSSAKSQEELNTEKDGLSKEVEDLKSQLAAATKAKSKAEKKYKKLSAPFEAIFATLNGDGDEDEEDD